MINLEVGKSIASMIAKAIGKVAVKKEVEAIDSRIAALQAKKAEKIGNVQVVDVAANIAKKGKMQASGNELLINVAANVNVKDICRNIERKLQRNLSVKNSEDFQLLYDCLHLFYTLKHQTTLPNVVFKNGNKSLHIDDYVKMRTSSVIKDASCHINFD